MKKNIKTDFEKNEKNVGCLPLYMRQGGMWEYNSEAQMIQAQRNMGTTC